MPKRPRAPGDPTLLRSDHCPAANSQVSASGTAGPMPPNSTVRSRASSCTKPWANRADGPGLASIGYQRLPLRCQLRAFAEDAASSERPPKSSQRSRRTSRAIRASKAAGGATLGSHGIQLVPTSSANRACGGWSGEPVASTAPPVTGFTASCCRPLQGTEATIGNCDQVRPSYSHSWAATDSPMRANTRPRTGSNTRRATAAGGEATGMIWVHASPSNSQVSAKYSCAKKPPNSTRRWRSGSKARPNRVRDGGNWPMASGCQVTPS